ncbi:MAG: hypothetical protein Kapaf2KO_16200 [Candidatus Kapaibacteriales bacterium]
MNIKYNNNILILAVISSLLISCFGEDEPVAPFNPDGTTISVVDMGRGYTEQNYFSLAFNEITASNDRYDYHLSFSCIEGRYEIWSNPALLMRVADLGNEAIDIPLNLQGRTLLYPNGDSLPFRNELYTGSKDDFFIGDWMAEGTTNSKNNLYIATLGLDDRARIAGYVRIKVDSVTGTDYYLRLADAEGENIRNIRIPRRPFINKVMFKIGEGETLDGEGIVGDIEPVSEDWDLHFTRYNDKAPDTNLDSFDYAVVGCLLNEKRLRAQDVYGDFDAFELADLSNINLTDSLNVIGYDWKYFSIEDDVYSYDTTRFWVVSTLEGISYKLRFVSFTDVQGTRGFPTFEFIKL